MSTFESCSEVKNQNLLFSDCEMENKVEIKEVTVSDTVLQREEAVKTKDNSDVHEMTMKIEVKEQPWWNERAAAGMKYQPDTSPVSDVEAEGDIKVEAAEDLSAAGSVRLHTEAVPNVSSAPETGFAMEDLKEKGSLEFERDKVHEVCGSNKTETSCNEQDVLLHKADTVNKPKPSEKVNKCNDDREKLYSCDICNKQFYQRRNLNAHILVHDGKKAFKCDTCEKSFIKMEDLREHTLIHEGKREYKCDVCQATFFQSGGLKRHSLTHVGERLYKCELCKKSFTRQQSLKSHHLSHQRKSVYKCDICKKSFTQIGDLKRHTLTH